MQQPATRKRHRDTFSWRPCTLSSFPACFPAWPLPPTTIRCHCTPAAPGPTATRSGCYLRVSQDAPSIACVKSSYINIRHQIYIHVEIILKYKLKLHILNRKITNFKLYRLEQKLLTTLNSFQKKLNIQEVWNIQSICLFGMTECGKRSQKVLNAFTFKLMEEKKVASIIS